MTAAAIVKSLRPVERPFIGRGISIARVPAEYAAANVVWTPRFTVIVVAVARLEPAGAATATVT